MNPRTALVTFCAATILPAAAILAGPAGGTSSGNALTHRLERDVQTAIVCRNGLHAVRSFMISRPDLYPIEEVNTPHLLNREQKREIRQTWKIALDYILALDRVGEVHSAFYKAKNAEHRETSFLIAYAAFVAEYRFALEFIRAIERDPSLNILLNDAVPGTGLPGGTYAGFKNRFLHVSRVSEFYLFRLHYRKLRGPGAGALRNAIDADTQVIRKVEHRKAPKLAVKNAGEYIKRKSFTAWFPVQKRVAEWMGDTKVYRKGVSLLSQEQAQAMRSCLHPGDIFIERREWFVSNVGLPGYWSHAAIYVGSPAERRRYFDDPQVKAWVRQKGQRSGEFDALLQAACPNAYRAALEKGHDGHAVRVIEAVSEGVIFTSLEHRADADAVAVLRPRLSRKDKAAVLLRAFSYWGRPYDFNFDFLTDSALACTELMCKAYEPSPETAGLRLTVPKIMGRMALPANEFVRQFAEEYRTPAQQMDFVLFLDGYEITREAVPANVEEFCASWERPNWHILLKGAPDKPESTEQRSPGG